MEVIMLSSKIIAICMIIISFMLVLDYATNTAKQVVSNKQLRDLFEEDKDIKVMYDGNEIELHNCDIDTALDKLEKTMSDKETITKEEFERAIATFKNDIN